MKYIRTTDGDIYETKDLIKCKDNHYPNDWFTKNDVPLTAIKESDNIEELCDEFVIKVKTGYLITYYDKKLLTQDASKNGADVYGAIWTYIGLIYIAKLTEKGWKLL